MLTFQAAVISIMGIDNYKGQKYDKLRKDLLKSGQLFTDPEFPPAQKSLFYTRTDEEIVWKRPTVSSHVSVNCLLQDRFIELTIDREQLC